MGSSHYLVFTLEDQQYALGLEAVERVVRAVELTSVPEAPEILVGLINIRGKIVPVLDIRRRFHLPPRDMEIKDRIIVSRTSSGQSPLLRTRSRVSQNLLKRRYMKPGRSCPIWRATWKGLVN